MKTISVYNHKGGVGKTTITYNMGYALADLGCSVILVDLDPQANLSILAMRDYESFLAGGGWTSAEGLDPLVTGAGDFGEPELVKIGDSVWLLPGSIDLVGFEGILPVAWTECLAGHVRGFRVTSALFRMLHRAGEEVGADFVLLDLGPNVGGLNRAAVLSSDYFMVPMTADLFSTRAVRNLGRTIREWSEQWDTALRHAPAIDFALPRGRSRFLGYIAQQFNVYRNRPTEAFEYWKSLMPRAVTEGITDALRPISLDTPGSTLGPQIGELKNFHSLAPKAQQAGKPIFHLSSQDGVFGGHLDVVEAARTGFGEIATNICEWTQDS